MKRNNVLAVGIAALLVCGVVANAEAPAASFGCAKAAGAAEKIVCADPALAEADEALARSYAEALAASLDPEGVKQSQQEWLIARKKLGDAPALRAAYQARIKELDDVVAAWRALPREIDAAELKSGCLALPGADAAQICKIEEAGEVNGGSEQKLFYRLQVYAKDDALSGGGALVFLKTGANGDRLKLIAATYNDWARYWRPALLPLGDALVLQMPGYDTGSGVISQERLYHYDQGKLTPIDSQGWHRELEKKLPKGLAFWNGIFPDYETMTASTALWKGSDAHCCPTGGVALIHLKLAGQRIALDRVTVRLGKDFPEEGPGEAPKKLPAKASPPPKSCGKPVPFALDAASFAASPAAADSAARAAAEFSGPKLIAQMLDRLCETEILPAAEIARKVQRILIAWIDGTGNVVASLPDTAGDAGALQVGWRWHAHDLPMLEDLRLGLLCAFRPKLVACTAPPHLP